MSALGFFNRYPLPLLEKAKDVSRAHPKQFSNPAGLAHPRLELSRNDSVKSRCGGLSGRDVSSPAASGNRSGAACIPRDEVVAPTFGDAASPLRAIATNAVRFWISRRRICMKTKNANQAARPGPALDLAGEAAKNPQPLPQPAGLRPANLARLGRFAGGVKFLEAGIPYSPLND